MAEELILQPIRDELLSAAAVERACELIRNLHRAELVAQTEPSATETARFEAKIAKYQAMILADPDSAPELRPVIERLHQEMGDLRRTSWKAAQKAKFERSLPAEQAYRQHVQQISERLGENDARMAQGIIKDILGNVPLRPDESGTFLLAEVNLNTAPLLKAAGVARNGSGGRI